MTKQYCQRCGIPHADNEGTSTGGGMGHILPWREHHCPACLDRQSEWRRRAARRYVDAVLDGDDYVTPSEPGQATLGEVLG